MGMEFDHSRFRQIIKGKIRKDLGKYISNGELIGKEGDKLISIPVPGIETPHFHYGSNAREGVGGGEGDVGDTLGGDPDQGNGHQCGGTEPGRHMLEVDITIEELADILGEKLQLPKIHPKGHKQILAERHIYKGIRKVGPEGLRHFKRTYKEALKRSIIMGIYDPDNPIIIPIKSDKRFKSWQPKYVPDSSAVIIYIMDISGSMGNEQKAIVRQEAFLIDTWLRRNYKNIENRYIVHDVNAKEVDKHTFYHIKEDGGTKISSAYKLALNLIKTHYGPEWNIYIYHFTDGDNSGLDDNIECVKLLDEQLLPMINLFGYCQVSGFSSGDFYAALLEKFIVNDKIVLSKISSKDEILDSIKLLFQKGK